jgi:hypothetical protein
MANQSLKDSILSMTLRKVFTCVDKHIIFTCCARQWRETTFRVTYEVKKYAKVQGIPADSCTAHSDPWRRCQLRKYRFADRALSRAVCRRADINFVAKWPVTASADKTRGRGGSRYKLLGPGSPGTDYVVYVFVFLDGIIICWLTN